MDKWDEIIHRIQQGVLAEEPEAALTAALQLFAEFGRTVDRIAVALEKQDVTISGEPLPLDL